MHLPWPSSTNSQHNVICCFLGTIVVSHLSNAIQIQGKDNHRSSLQKLHAFELVRVQETPTMHYSIFLYRSRTTRETLWGISLRNTFLVEILFIEIVYWGGFYYMLAQVSTINSSLLHIAQILRYYINI